MNNIHHISDLVKSYISGDWGSDIPTQECTNLVACVRGADINNLNNGQFEALPMRYISTSALQQKCLPAGSIIIEKSGGAPTQSTGRVAFNSEECVRANNNIICSNFCSAFSVRPEWDAKYVFYYLQYIYRLGVFFNFEGKTSGIRNLQVEQAFASIPIKQIPLQMQRSIASILSTIDCEISLNRQINQNLSFRPCTISRRAIARYGSTCITRLPDRSSATATTRYVA